MGLRGHRVGAGRGGVRRHRVRRADPGGGAPRRRRPPRGPAAAAAGRPGPQIPDGSRWPTSCTAEPERTVRRMADRPYTLLSCGMSIDGYLDSADAARLRLSNAADFDRVDAERARCDAILVGAATDPGRQPAPAGPLGGPARRTDVARAPGITGQGHAHPAGRPGRNGRLLHDGRLGQDRLLPQPGRRATSGPGWVRSRPSSTPARRRTSTWRGVLEHLSARGIDRVMVEGGGTVLTQFLTADLVDELHLVVAPLFVGDSRAPRLVGDGLLPLERPPPGAAGRRPADRRRGAAPVRAVRPVLRRARAPVTTDGSPSCPTRRSAPRSGSRCAFPTATPRRPSSPASAVSSTAGSTSRSRVAARRPSRWSARTANA